MEKILLYDLVHKMLNDLPENHKKKYIAKINKLEKTLIKPPVWC